MEKVAASRGASTSESSTKSLICVSSPSPIGVSSDIVSCAIFLISLTLSGVTLNNSGYGLPDPPERIS
jgi:predicted transporter